MTVTKYVAIFAIIFAIASLFIVAVSPAKAASSIPLCEIQRNLAVGITGADVACLQRYLNWSGNTVAASGPGSPGNETSYYGALTAQAVARWQNNHAAQVLTPLGLSSGTGYWGSASFSAYVGIVQHELGS